MTAVAGVPSETPTADQSPRSLRSLLLSTELDTRLLGMIGALLVVWIGFDLLSGGAFLTPRNLWNLSVQSASVAIMATGMVLIIVSRNIDLSVGSILGFTGMVMALMQAEWLPQGLGLGFNQPYFWVVVLIAGLACGALIGALQGFIVAYIGVPSFIVTLGGLLVWRGLTFQLASGQTIAPMDSTYAAARRRPARVARRDPQLGRRHPRLRRDPLLADGDPSPPATLRVPRPPAVGGGPRRRRRLRRRPRRRLGGQQLLLARAARTQLRRPSTGSRGPRAA